MVGTYRSTDYRANKLKLALQGDAFGYINFRVLKTPCVQNGQWINLILIFTIIIQINEQIIEKLKDRFMKVQAIEVNIY